MPKQNMSLGLWKENNSDYHYVLIKDDYSDLEKLNYYINNLDKKVYFKMLISMYLDLDTKTEKIISTCNGEAGIMSKKSSIDFS